MPPHPHDLLSAYVDGSLTDDQAAQVAAHLAECAECRDTVMDLTAVHRLLGQVSRPAPHPSLLPRTLARLPDARPRPRVVPPKVAAAAVSALLLALLLQIRVVPPPMGEEARDWFFRSHAQIAASHPVADVALTAYLGTTLPYAPDIAEADQTR